MGTDTIALWTFSPQTGCVSAHPPGSSIAAISILSGFLHRARAAGDALRKPLSRNPDQSSTVWRREKPAANHVASRTPFGRPVNRFRPIPLTNPVCWPRDDHQRRLPAGQSRASSPHAAKIGAGRGMSFASFRRFWAMAANRNSSLAPLGPRRRSRSEEHLDLLSLPA